MSSNKPKAIVFSPQALKDLDELYAYLQAEWGAKVVATFHQKLEHFLINIALQPRLFAYINKRKNLRKYLLYKKNLVIYKVSRSAIEIVAIIDASAGPENVKKVLRKR